MLLRFRKLSRRHLIWIRGRQMSFLQDFEVIRKDRMGVVNSSVYPGLKTLVSQIYPDEAHFIYELLQNAEDAQSFEKLILMAKSKEGAQSGTI